MVGRGVSIEADVRIGQWVLVGAGAVVTADVPAHALVVRLPARKIGWAGRMGAWLVAEGPGSWSCPWDGSRYAERDGDLGGVR